MKKLIQKSYDNTPTLYLIPTPIGNMDDITIRSLETLKKVDVVLAEDTRVARQLLSHFDIKQKLVANHNFNEKDNINKVISYLENNLNIGLISDRGTPVISDPGYETVKTVVDLGYNVVSLPGATALIPAITVSGLPPMPFLFYGFLNSKDSKQKTELESLKKEKATIIFYEAPHRIVQTLRNILEVFGDRDCSISREITKRFESVYRGKISELIPIMDDIKGELVVCVSGNNENPTYEHFTIIEHVNLYIREGFSSMDAIKKVAKERQLPKSEIYQQYHKGE